MHRRTSYEISLYKRIELIVTETVYEYQVLRAIDEQRKHVPACDHALFATLTMQSFTAKLIRTKGI